MTQRTAGSPAVFLDRDGVIIENRANYVRSWADVEIYPWAMKALHDLSRSPFKIVLVTNQSVVGRGIIALDVAEAINRQLVREIKAAGGRVDGVYMCPHAPADACHCRKPLPGLLAQAAAAHQLDVGRSIMIGDALTDLVAGSAAGVKRLILLKSGRGAAQLMCPEAADLPPFSVFNTLAEAVAALLKQPPPDQAV